MSALSRLITSRAQATVEGPGVEDVQDPLMEVDDQLYYITNEHVPNTFRGQAFTRMVAGMPPPFPVEPPDEVGDDQPVTLTYFHPHTRPGVGPDDMEPMIPEGEDGL